MNAPASGRRASVSRKTNETAIEASVDLDGSGKYAVSTGVGFFDHMLEQLSRHSLIDLTLEAKGDLHIDDHHTVEDAGIAIGHSYPFNVPLVEGTTPACRASGSIAIRSARATALKQVSAMWWLFAP